MSEGNTVKREIARVKMPMSMTALGKLLTCFGEEFIGSYARYQGDYLIIYIDVKEAE